MVFKFPSMDALHKADDEWRALSSRPDAGEAVAWIYERGKYERKTLSVQQPQLVKKGWTETPLYAHPPAAVAGEGLTLRDVEAQSIELMEKASQREGMKLNDWVAHRLRTIAERALSQPAADAVGTGEDWRHKLRMVISHASGGHLSDDADADRPLNDICVAISQHHNRVWEAALEKGRKEALSTQPRQPDANLVAAKLWSDDAKRLSAMREIMTEIDDILAAHDPIGRAQRKEIDKLRERLGYLVTDQMIDALAQVFDASSTTSASARQPDDAVRKAADRVIDLIRTVLEEQTSDNIFGYVLIPTAKFEQIVGALSSTKSPDADGGAK
jgi:hypothetical protein